MHRDYEDCEKICDRNSEFKIPIFSRLHPFTFSSFEVCELIPTPKCQMTPCPVDATFVGELKKDTAIKKLLGEANAKCHSVSKLINVCSCFVGREGGDILVKTYFISFGQLFLTPLCCRALRGIL